MLIQAVIKSKKSRRDSGTECRMHLHILQVFVQYFMKVSFNGACCTVTSQVFREKLCTLLTFSHHKLTGESLPSFVFYFFIFFKTADIFLIIKKFLGGGKESVMRSPPRHALLVRARLDLN